MQKLAAFITPGWGRPDERTEEIAAPVLAVNGGNDFILPGYALRLARSMPGAQLAVLPGTTHMTDLERPELLPMIQRFIGDVAARASN